MQQEPIQERTLSDVIARMACLPVMGLMAPPPPVARVAHDAEIERGNETEHCWRKYNSPEGSGRCVECRSCAAWGRWRGCDVRSFSEGRWLIHDRAADGCKRLKYPADVAAGFFMAADFPAMSDVRGDRRRRDHRIGGGP